VLAAQRHDNDHSISNHSGPSMSNSHGLGASESMCQDSMDDDERVDVVGNDHRPDSVSPSPSRHHGKSSAYTCSRPQLEKLLHSVDLRL